MKIIKYATCLILFQLLLSNCKNEDYTPLIKKKYYTDGNLREIVIYKDSLKREYSYKSYYPNGGLQDSGYYIDNKLDGQVVVFHENGRLWNRYHMKNGIEDGTLSEYNENGEILYEEFYVKGEFICRLDFNKIAKEGITRVDVSRMYDTVIKRHGVVFYDSINNIIRDSSLYFFAEGPDTIDLGDTYNLKVEGLTMGHDLKSSKLILVDVYNNLGFDSDTIRVISDNMNIDFNFIPEEVGYNYIYGVFRMCRDITDKSTCKDFFIYKDFYVRSKNKIGLQKQEGY